MKHLILTVQLPLHLKMCTSSEFLEIQVLHKDGEPKQALKDATRQYRRSDFCPLYPSCPVLGSVEHLPKDFLWQRNPRNRSQKS